MPVSATSRTTTLLDTLAPESEADLLRAGIDALRMRLPATWSLEVRHREPQRGARHPDAELLLGAPDGTAVTIVVEAKRLLSTRDVPGVLDQLQQIASIMDLSGQMVPMLIARYLPPTTRERIIEAGASYADATGNVYISLDQPSLFLRDRGADNDPWRGPGRPRGTLKGQPASRVVRALVDYAPPCTVPELAARAGASTGATYRVVEFLEEEDLLRRERYGPITTVRWRAILERWSQDYSFTASNAVRTYLEPRGLGVFTERLAAAEGLQYVVTGSLAAERLAPYAPPRLATVYVKDATAAAERLGLRAVDSGTNVVLAETKYEVVFDRSETVDGLRVAAASQVAVDLLTGPGRNPSEAVAVLDWMEVRESAWRK